MSTPSYFDIDEADEARGEKDKHRYAGFFVSGKASKERCEGAYIRYVTEQIDEADEARGEKDK